jgi:hypothetical protein
MLDWADLRFNTLVLLGSITEAKDYVSVYRRCLRDKDPRIRALALKELNETERIFLDLKKRLKRCCLSPI